MPPDRCTEKDHTHGIPVTGAYILQNNWLMLLNDINDKKDKERLRCCSIHDSQMQCMALNWILDQGNHCYEGLH